MLEETAGIAVQYRIRVNTFERRCRIVAPFSEDLKEDMRNRELATLSEDGAWGAFALTGEGYGQETQTTLLRALRHTGFSRKVDAGCK